VSLIGLLASAGDVVPQTNAGVECMCEDIAAIGGESGRRYGGIVFVDNGSKALTCRCVPDSTISLTLVYTKVTGSEKTHT
jgi:hypothetical protein